jgi:kynurenine formamidase
MITSDSRSRILARADASRYYDLSVEYFMGMPTWVAAGDPHYQIWMSHTPSGTVIDNLPGQTREINQQIGYSGDVLLPDSYPITPEDLQATVDRQRVRLDQGDVVAIRTGRMTVWEDPQRFLANGPGINVKAAQWLVEGHGAMIVGADQATVEYQPSTDVPGHYLPVHLYLIAEMGVPMLEIMWLEELARDRVYEFAFFGAPLRLRGIAAPSPRPQFFDCGHR